jgi:hypothetical protein
MPGVSKKNRGRAFHPSFRKVTLHKATATLVVLTACATWMCPTVFGQEAIAETAPKASPPAAEKIVFQKMPVDLVRTELLQWLASTGADRERLQTVTQKWADTNALTALSGEELLDLLVNSFAQVDNATQRLVEESYSAAPPAGVVFDGIREATIFRNQVQQFRARWMVQHRFYDEASPLLAELAPEAVVDPAGLLFYRALCQSQLMQRSEAIESLSLLLNNTLDVPDRFRVIAEMLQEELANRKDDGLNQVKQLMQDVERRLDLGRAGEDTQQQEIAIIVALDQLLEEMENQKKKQQSSSGDGEGDPQSQPGGQGADRSVIKGGNSSTGDADRKELSEKGSWGMLDKQAEAKARELIRQKFPPNFLDQIGRYTKKLAEQKK